MRWLLNGNVLENESRLAIYRYIKANPGTYSREIMRDTNIRRGTALYHLDILLLTGKVACLKDGRLKKYRAVQTAV
jgi:predicted transcriptional regulator